MFSVVKRNGRTERVSFDQIQQRNAEVAAAAGLTGSGVDIGLLTKRVISGMRDHMHTHELDTLSAEVAMALSLQHPHYARLAAAIALSNLAKSTPATWRQCLLLLQAHHDGFLGRACPVLDPEVVSLAFRHIDRLEAAVDHSRDALLSFFAVRTLERSYLLRANAAATSSLVGAGTGTGTGTGGGRVPRPDPIAERPQYMWMRVALGVHGHAFLALGAHDRTPEAEARTVDDILGTYELLSTLQATHATPTLCNAATRRPQMSSCFLLGMDDSIDGIYRCLQQCALISKDAGGIGVSVTNVRARGSRIHGTGGRSNGLVPMLRVFNETARYVDQGGGKRKGSIAAFLEPWHADVMDFLDLRLNTGQEETRTRDLFTGMWVPDLFMRRVEADGPWSLFCPGELPDGVRLQDLFGAAFEAAYERLEQLHQGRLARQVLPARTVWARLLASQAETGLPYVLFKDHINRKSNHANIGPIRGSNLCCEIVQYSDAGSTSVCNLASVSLPACLCEEKAGEGKGAGTRTARLVFSYPKLAAVTATLARNLNRVIDGGMYPTPESRRTNLEQRPIGIGVQGFADVLAALGLDWDSAEALRMSAQVFETMYFAALQASCQEARAHGAYPLFAGSPLSQGKFQFDLWGHTPEAHDGQAQTCDWEGLRAEIGRYGVRNSMVLAPMPTASTAQILGNNECFEPFTSNVYVRKTLSGEFPVFNRTMVEELVGAGKWTAEVAQSLLAHNGSVQALGDDVVSPAFRRKYRTAWELPMKSVLDHAVARGPFVDQSSSTNLFFARPTPYLLGSALMYGWQRGLKTGSYYIRSRPAADPIKFTLSLAPGGALPQPVAENATVVVAAAADEADMDVCTACSG
jgi:ribonucleoside-diphosphate reductase alpha subunit